MATMFDFGRPALLLTAALTTASPSFAQPMAVLDLADEAAAADVVLRVRGATGDGSFGVPLASGFDTDGDSFVDSAVAYMTASPLGRTFAGEVDLVFGDGTIAGEIDTAVPQERVLRIFGDQVQESAGSEVWMADVTGDGLGDLLICRQNYSPGGRFGAGALTILAGGPELRTYSQGLAPLDLRTPPPSLTLTHVVGASTGDRLCIWTRTGDVTGDGIDDVVVGADQQAGGGATHRGAVYVLMGGAHLAAGGTLDLADLTAPALAGMVAHVFPPAGSSHHHFGATCQIGDLDGNGVGEVMAASTLNRAGASLAPQSVPTPPHASGGVLDGELHILWDDNFTLLPWPTPFAFSVSAPPGSRTHLRGETRNVSFGEELLGGLDYDGDGAADLFIGDLAGDATPAQNRSFSGVGYLVYRAADLKGLVNLRLIDLPPAIRTTTILGPNAGAIGADTAAHGDFDADGLADLAYCSPHGRPQGRLNAGVVHVLRGRLGGWPDLIDTASLPSPGLVQILEIQGARARVSSSDDGDVLCYSGAAGDVDGDGATDFVVNEMNGNGTGPGALDVGNLLVIDLSRDLQEIFRDGFESGDTARWSVVQP
jgi:hypothetical protein